MRRLSMRLALSLLGWNFQKSNFNLVLSLSKDEYASMSTARSPDGAQRNPG
jgi:hypothetical protein